MLWNDNKMFAGFKPAAQQRDSITIRSDANEWSQSVGAVFSAIQTIEFESRQIKHVEFYANEVCYSISHCGGLSNPAEISCHNGIRNQVDIQHYGRTRIALQQ